MSGFKGVGGLANKVEGPCTFGGPILPPGGPLQALFIGNPLSPSTCPQTTRAQGEGPFPLRARGPSGGVGAPGPAPDQGGGVFRAVGARAHRWGWGPPLLLSQVSRPGGGFGVRLSSGLHENLCGTTGGSAWWKGSSFGPGRPGPGNKSPSIE